MKMESSHSFHLITLYSNTEAERKILQPAQRLGRHRLMQQDPEGHQQIEIRQPVKDLCRTLDGLVFVVDATAEASAGKI